MNTLLVRNDRVSVPETGPEGIPSPAGSGVDGTEAAQKDELVRNAQLFSRNRRKLSRAGLEPTRVTEDTQVTDSINRQIRQNRLFRRFEVHGGYTGYEFFSSGGHDE